MRKIYSTQEIDRKFYKARQSGDYSQLRQIAMDNISDINRRLRAWSKAGLSDAYHPAAITRLAQKLEIATPSGYLTAKSAPYWRLSSKDLRELILTERAFQTSKYKTELQYINGLRQKLDTMLQHDVDNRLSAKHLTPENMHKFFTDDNVQQALKFNGNGLDSEQVIEDYLRYLDEGKTLEDFSAALGEFFGSTNKYKSYWDFI